LSVIKEGEVDYVGVTGINNLAANLLDPLVLGLMKETKTCVTMDTIRRSGLYRQFPVFLEDSDQNIDLYYEKEAASLSKEFDLFPKYCSPDLNLITTVDEIEKVMRSNPADFFHYRSKELKLDIIDSGGKQNLSEIFTFEMNITNLLKNSGSCKLIIRPQKNIPIWIDKDKFTEDEAARKLAELAEEWVAFNMKDCIKLYAQFYPDRRRMIKVLSRGLDAKDNQYF